MLDGERHSWTNPIWEQIRERQHELFDGAFVWSDTQFDLARAAKPSSSNGCG